MKNKIILLMTAASLVFAQLGMYASAEKINAALHEQVSASSSVSEDNAPDMANDGINDNESYTYWKSGEGDELPWWQVDLGLMYYVSEIEIKARLGEADAQERMGFRILGATEKDFSDAIVLAEVNEDYGERYVLTLSDTRVEYIRVEKTVPGALSIGEISVYTEKDGILQGADYINNNVKVTEAVQAEAIAEGASYVIPEDVIGTRYENAVRVLSGLGIMKGYPDGSFKPDSGITRAEFAKIAAKLLGYTVSGGAQSFSDVPKSHWAYDVVETAAYAGAVNGTAPGIFSPDMAVTTPQAAKILTSILGYGLVAEAKGGYPGGYMTQAADIGLFKTVNISDDVITRGSIAIMAVNALETKMMLQTAYGENPEASTFTGRTLMTENLKINKARGIVTGVRGTSLTSANNKDNLQYIEIAGVRYESKIPNLEQYLGKSVEFYYETEGDEPREVFVICEMDRNNIMEIDSDYIEGIDGNRLSYREEDGKEKKVSLSSVMDVIYNGLALRDYEKSALIPTYGSVTLIDNDGDEIYDVYMVSSIENYVVNRVNMDKGIVTSKNNSSMLTLDYEEDIITITKKGTGAEAALEELEEWNVLSVAKSVNSAGKKVINAVLSDDSISGKLEATGENHIVIGGQEYKTAKSFDRFDVKIGDEGVFYLDMNDKIAAFDGQQTASMKYGYLKKVAEKGDIDNILEFRILTENSGFVTFESNPEKLRVDNKRYTTNSEVLSHLEANSSEAGQVYQPVRYKTDSQGRITDIDTVTPGTGEDDDALAVAYNSSTDHTLGQVYYTPTGTFEAQFGINEETVIMQIPEGADELADEDEYEMITSAALGVDQQYRVKAYNKKDGNIVKLLLVCGEMAKNELTSNKLMLVDKVVMALDEDGNSVAKVCGLYGGVSVEYLEYENGIVSASALKRGDVITLTLTGGNKIKGYEKKFYAGDLPGGITHTAVSENQPQAGDVNATYYAYGKVMSMKDGIIAIEFSTSTPYKTLTVNTGANDLDIYYYDSTEDKVKAEDSSCIFDASSAGTENASYVLVRISQRRESELVVFGK